jgi:hypothetical protein
MRKGFRLYEVKTKMSLFYHLGILEKYGSIVPLRSLYDFATDHIFNSVAERKNNRTGTESDPDPVGFCRGNGSAAPTFLLITSMKQLLPCMK